MITFLSLGKYGRLGNQMFQIAGTIGLATKHGYGYGFPLWRNYDHAGRFCSDEDINIQEYFKHPLPGVDRTKFKDYNVGWGYHDVWIPDNVSLGGHMQSEKYFTHCANIIRYYFELNELSRIRIPADAIAIHVRLGDYDNDYHPRLDMKYYGRALRDFPANSKLYIFSDTIYEVRGAFGGNAEYVEGNHYMVDFYLMCRFRNFIIGNSTFSWWPAWLCQDPAKIVYAPAHWFGPMARISSRDIYPDGWNVV
jgi:hypothetical protein